MNYMSLIKIYQGKSKPAKKKPGWQKQEEEYKAWLAKHTPSSSDLIRLATARRALSKSSKPAAACAPPKLSTNKATFISEKSDAINDPRVLYKDDPEMLERELKARERKFNTAPVYNKGPDTLMTDEMMKDLKLGLLRRR